MREQVDPSFSIWSRGEPLDEIACHGPLWGRWPSVGGDHNVGIQTVPHGEEAQAVEAVDDELETPKMNVFTEEEATA
jgi:hypothetical protein